MERADRGQWVFYYDGHCGFCTKTVNILAGMDFFHQLTWSDFRRLETPPGGLCWDDLTREAYLSTAGAAAEGTAAGPAPTGRLYGGFYAFRMLSLRLPPLMPLVPLLWLPGVNRLGEVVYRWVANNRFRLSRVCRRPFR